MDLIRFWIILPSLQLCVCCNCTLDLLLITAHHKQISPPNLFHSPWSTVHKHTSLCSVALDPFHDRRGAHFITAGNTHVVPRHGLQPRDFRLERRHCDIDESGGCYLSFPPTHLFHLREHKRKCEINLRSFQQTVCVCAIKLTLMWHLVSGEKPSCPGIQLKINLLDCLSITVTLDTGLGSTVKCH